MESTNQQPNHQPEHRLSGEQTYNLTPQTYVRIPGLIFDPVPILIPHSHRAALDFLKPSGFRLDLSWRDYYEPLQPFDDVAFKLTDIFEYCIDEVKHNVPDAAAAAAARADAVQAEAETDESAGKPHKDTNWKALFERVLENLGPEGRRSGMSGEDVMWVAFLYTRAYDNTPAFVRGRDREHFLRANIHYLHDLLGEWQMVMRKRGLTWQVVFFDVFGG